MSDYPVIWEVVKLGEFVESEKGKKPKNSKLKQTKSCHLPYVDIAAFEENVIKSWTDGKGCNLCDENDFLMVWDGSRSGLVGRAIKGAVGSTLVRINFPGINNDYAYYFLRSKYLEINSRAKGSGTPHVDPDLLWNYEFPIPNLEQQEKIVTKIESLFSELDKGIESLKAAREQLKVYRQAILKHAFEGKLTAQWREENKDKLESRDQLLTRIQQEREAHYQQQLKEWKSAVKKWEKHGKEGKKPGKPKAQVKPSVIQKQDIQIPSHWTLLNLEGLAVECVLGKMLDKQKNSGVERPYLGNINVRWGSFVLDDLKSIKVEESEIERYSLSEGDLVICEGGEPGRCAVWQGNKPAIIIQKALHRVRFTESLHPKFAYYYLVCSTPLEHITKHFTGTTIKHLTGAGLKKVQFPICTLYEQKEIVKILESLLSEISAMEYEIDTQTLRTETLRQSILKKAFSGQLVPQDPNDEPASKLLERIRNEREKTESKKTTKKKSQRKKKATA